MNLTETTASSIANEQLIDRMPESIKKVYIYQVVNTDIDIPLYIPNGKSIVRVTNDNNIFDKMLEDENSKFYIEAVSSSTLQEYLSAAPATQTIDQKLRNLKDLTIYTNHKFNGNETDRFFITLGKPFDFRLYTEGQQLIYELENTENLDLVDIDDVTEEQEELALETGYIRELKLSSVLMKTQSLGVFTDIYLVESSLPMWDNMSEVEIEINKEIMLGNSYGVANVGDENLPIDFVSNNDKLTPIKIQPTEISNKVEYFHDWADLDIVLPFEEAEKMISKDGLTLSAIFDNVEDREIIKDVILFTYASVSQYKAIARNDQGKFDPKWKIGHNQTPLNSLLDSNDIQLAINKLFETFLYDYPEKRKNGDYRKIKAVAIGLSRYIRWQEAIAKGNNPLNQAYLPWYLEMTSKLEVEVSTDVLVLKNEPTFKLTSEWFDIVEEDETINLKRTKGIHNKPFVDWTNSKLIQFPERKMELGKLDAQFSSGSLKSSIGGGDINSNSVKDFNYVLYGLDSQNDISNYLSQKPDEIKYDLNTEYNFNLSALPIAYIPSEIVSKNNNLNNIFYQINSGIISENVETELSNTKTILEGMILDKTYEESTSNSIFKTPVSLNNSTYWVGDLYVYKGTNGVISRVTVPSEVNERFAKLIKDNATNKIYLINNDWTGVYELDTTTDTFTKLDSLSSFTGGEPYIMAIHDGIIIYSQGVSKTTFYNISTKVHNEFNTVYEPMLYPESVQDGKIYFYNDITTTTHDSGIYTLDKDNLTYKIVHTAPRVSPATLIGQDIEGRFILGFNSTVFTTEYDYLDVNTSTWKKCIELPTVGIYMSNGYMYSQLGSNLWRQKLNGEKEFYISYDTNELPLNLTGYEYYSRNAWMPQLDGKYIYGITRLDKYRTHYNAVFEDKIVTIPNDKTSINNALYNIQHTNGYRSGFERLYLILQVINSLRIEKFNLSIPEIVIVEKTTNKGTTSLKNIIKTSGDDDATIIMKAMLNPDGRMKWVDIFKDIPVDKNDYAQLIRDNLSWFEENMVRIISKSDKIAVVEYMKFTKDDTIKFIKALDSSGGNIAFTQKLFQSGHPKYDKSSWLTKVTATDVTPSTLKLLQNKDNYSTNLIDKMIKFTFIANKGSYIKFVNNKHGNLSEYKFELNSNKDETVNQTEFLFV